MYKNNEDGEEDPTQPSAVASLTSLNLSSNKIDQSGCSSLCELLVKTQHLATLSLANVRLDDASLRTLTNGWLNREGAPSLHPHLTLIGPSLSPFTSFFTCFYPHFRGNKLET